MKPCVQWCGKPTDKTIIYILLGFCVVFPTVRGCGNVGNFFEKVLQEIYKDFLK